MYAGKRNLLFFGRKVGKVEISIRKRTFEEKDKCIWKDQFVVS